MADTISPQVAFQGEPGAYSEAAALEHFGPSVCTIPCESFEDVFKAVESGQSELGLIAIENSLAGSIHRNYDLLMQNNVWIVGEHYLRVRHCLIAPQNTRVEEIRRVISHPQALAQCDGYVRSRGWKSEVFYDTAGAVKHLSQTVEPGTAAIASCRAAEVYQMQVLAEGIEDNPANFTRFQVISKTPVPSGEDAKTTIVFTLKNEPGSLFKASSVFALRDIDLTKIESRPLVGTPWEYLFYIDFASSIDRPVVSRALAHLEEYSKTLRILGSYPRHRF
jgi:prephenate dehydratase